MYLINGKLNADENFRNMTQNADGVAILDLAAILDFKKKKIVGIKINMDIIGTTYIENMSYIV